MKYEILKYKEEGFVVALNDAKDTIFTCGTNAIKTGDISRSDFDNLKEKIGGGKVIIEDSLKNALGNYETQAKSSTKNYEIVKLDDAYLVATMTEAAEYTPKGQKVSDISFDTFYLERERTGFSKQLESTTVLQAIHDYSDPVKAQVSKVAV